MMIYAKLDWYTVMLYNTSIECALSKLNIDTEIYEELLASCYERSYGFTSKAVFSVYGVSCELDQDDYLSTEQGSIFHKKFGKIRLDISGHGLDYLRSFFEVDTKLMSPDFWGEREDFNVTRSDFAFDFVNYQPEFLDTFLNYIKDKERAGELIPNSSRLRCGGSGKNIQYSYVCGDQQTLRLGSPRGDKLLRIYNKLLQYQKNGVLMKPLPEAFKDEGEVKSWFRIEFQTRRKSAEAYLYGYKKLEDTLRFIFKEYMIRDEQGKPLDFIMNLYDWDKLPEIRQNADFV